MITGYCTNWWQAVKRIFFSTGPTILDKINGKPRPPSHPNQGRENGAFLPFAWLRPWFGGDRGLLFHFILSKIVARNSVTIYFGIFFTINFLFEVRRSLRSWRESCARGPFFVASHAGVFRGAGISSLGKKYGLFTIYMGKPVGLRFG